jgi:hypothetical protein
MGKDNFDYDIEQWKKLKEIEKNNIINNYWDPYNPTIGQKTKSEIVDDFIQKLKIPGEQFGLKTFGWTVYMLYVVVDNSRQRVPTNFLGLPINKGVIINNSISDKTIVKFKYGGTIELDLTKKIIIS